LETAREIAEASPFSIWVEDGTSYTGIPLGYAVVASEERIARLDSLKQAVRAFGDPREGSPAAMPPLVVWVTAGVHGNELSPPHAALRILEELTDPSDPRAASIRDSTIVLIDPLRNPDGRARALSQRVQWRSRITVDDQQSLHHRELWPSGRGNHYLIDLNRDCFELSQPETRARAKALTEWDPQLVLDMHEMRRCDTYLFSPPRQPFPASLPSHIEALWSDLSSEVALQLDAEGTLFYTGDWHEVLAPDRFVAYSLRRGAVAFLLEAGAVDAGVLRCPDGSVRTFGQAIDQHRSAAMALIEAASQRRTEFLRAFRDFREQVTGGRWAWKEDGYRLLAGLQDTTAEASGFKSSAQRVPHSPELRCVLLPPAGNASRLRHLVRLLLAQGINVGRTKTQVALPKSVDERGLEHGPDAFPEGTYVVDLHQPLGALAADLLLPAGAVPESWLAEERVLLEAGKATSLYSYSTWSLPILWAVKAWYSTVPVQTEPVLAADLRASTEAADPPPAVVLDAAFDGAPQAAAALASMGSVPRLASKTFRIGDRRFAEGSAILLHPTRQTWVTLRRLADSYDFEPFEARSLLSDEGPDLAGRSMIPMARPSVAVLAGSGVSSTAFGRIWHLFDARSGLPLTLLPIYGLRQASLQAYTTIVVPQPPRDRTERLARLIGPAARSRLLSWVREGGVLVLCGDAIASFSDAEGEEPLGLVPLRSLIEATGSLSPTSGDSILVQLRARVTSGLSHLSAADADRALRRFQPPGAALLAERLRSSWLLAGQMKRFAVPVRSSYAYLGGAETDIEARFVGPDELCASGLLWPEAAARLARSDAVAVEKMGKGAVIYIVGDFSRGSVVLDRLLLNAALLGPTLATERNR